MWTIVYLGYLVVVALRGLFAALAVGGCLLMFVIHFKGRSVGVTYNEQRLGLRGLVAFLAGIILWIAAFAGVEGLRMWHDGAVIAGTTPVLAECSRLGDARQLPPPGRLLIWDLPSNKRSEANAGIRSEWQATIGDEQLVFFIGAEYDTPLPNVRRVVDVRVARWPDNEPLGQYQVLLDGVDSLDVFDFANVKVFGAKERAVALWINGLPNRADGDGASIRLDSTEPPGMTDDHPVLGL